MGPDPRNSLSKRRGASEVGCGGRGCGLRGKGLRRKWAAPKDAPGTRLVEGWCRKGPSGREKSPPTREIWEHGKGQHFRSSDRRLGRDFGDLGVPPYGGRRVYAPFRLR